jgi:hypothetical protein
MSPTRRTQARGSDSASAADSFVSTLQTLCTSGKLTSDVEMTQRPGLLAAGLAASPTRPGALPLAQALTVILVSMKAIRTTLGGSHRDIVCYSWQRGAVVMDIDHVVQTWDAQADVQAALGARSVCIPHPFLELLRVGAGATGSSSSHASQPSESLSSLTPSMDSVAPVRGSLASSSATGKSQSTTQPGGQAGSPSHAGAGGFDSEGGVRRVSDALCPPDVATPGVQLPSALLLALRRASGAQTVSPRTAPGTAMHMPVGNLKDADSDSGLSPARGPGAALGLAVVPWCRVALHLHLPRTYHLAMWASTLGVFPGATSAFVEAVHGEGPGYMTPLVLCMANAMVDALLVRYMEPARYQLSLCSLLQPEAPQPEGASASESPIDLKVRDGARPGRPKAIQLATSRSHDGHDAGLGPGSRGDDHHASDDTHGDGNLLGESRWDHPTQRSPIPLKHAAAVAAVPHGAAPDFFAAAAAADAGADAAVTTWSSSGTAWARRRDEALVPLAFASSEPDDLKLGCQNGPGRPGQTILPLRTHGAKLDDMEDRHGPAAVWWWTRPLADGAAQAVPKVIATLSHPGWCVCVRAHSLIRRPCALAR